MAVAVAASSSGEAGVGTLTWPHPSTGHTISTWGRAAAAGANRSPPASQPLVAGAAAAALPEAVAALAAGAVALVCADCAAPRVRDDTRLAFAPSPPATAASASGAVASACVVCAPRVRDETRPSLTTLPRMACMRRWWRRANPEGVESGGGGRGGCTGTKANSRHANCGGTPWPVVGGGAGRGGSGGHASGAGGGGEGGGGGGKGGGGGGGGTVMVAATEASAAAAAG